MTRPQRLSLAISALAICAAAFNLLTADVGMAWAARGGNGVALSSNTESVSVDTTVGGTAVPTTALTNRTDVQIFVPDAETDTLYCSTGTPTSTNHFIALTGGQSWGDTLGSGVTLKCLSSSGTIAVKLLELGR